MGKELGCPQPQPRPWPQFEVFGLIGGSTDLVNRTGLVKIYIVQRERI